MLSCFNVDAAKCCCPGGRQRAGAKLTPQPIQVLLVGDDGSGKTSFLRRYIYNRRPSHHAYTKSIRRGKKLWLLRSEMIAIELHDIPSRVNLEQYPVLLKSQIFIICVDSTSSTLSESLESFLTSPTLQAAKEISTYSIVCVALTKADLLSDEQKAHLVNKLQILGARFDSVVHLWSFVSSLTGLGLSAPHDLVKYACRKYLKALEMQTVAPGALGEINVQSESLFSFSSKTSAVG